MKREIVLIEKFKKELQKLIEKKKILKSDFEDFKKELMENPKKGDTISGTSGIRKIRLKSSSGGKSGGFRICYYYYVIREQIYLIYIYAKNEQENLTTEQKYILSEIANEIKKSYKK